MIDGVRLKTAEAEIDSLKKFINYHTTVLIVSSLVISCVGLVMVYRLRTTPADVFAKVSELEEKTVTREELSTVIESTAPWAVDKEEWKQWRGRVDARLYELQSERKD